MDCSVFQKTKRKKQREKERSSESKRCLAIYLEEWETRFISDAQNGVIRTSEEEKTKNDTKGWLIQKQLIQYKKTKTKQIKQIGQSRLDMMDAEGGLITCKINRRIRAMCCCSFSTTVNREVKQKITQSSIIIMQ